MAYFDSDVSVFKIEDSAVSTLRDISAHLTDVDGLPGAGTLRNVQGLGAGGRKSIRGTEEVTFSISGNYSDTATTGSHPVLAGLRTLTVTAAFEYGPEGGSNPDVKYSGECFMSEFVETSRVGSQVQFRATFLVDGVVTVGTF